MSEHTIKSRQLLASAAAVDTTVVVVGSGVVVVGSVVVFGWDVVGFGVVVVGSGVVGFRVVVVVVVGSDVVASGVVVDVGALVVGSGAVADLTDTTVDCADVGILAVVRSSVVGAVDKRTEQKGSGYC